MINDDLNNNIFPFVFAYIDGVVVVVSMISDQ